MKKTALLLILLAFLQWQVNGQSISEVLENTNAELGTELLSSKNTIQYKLIQKHESVSQSYRITVKGRNKIRADIEQANGSASYIRNGSKYFLETGSFSKEVTSSQTKKNLNRQNLVRGLLRVLNIEVGATIEAQVTENGRSLYRINSEDGNRKNVLFIDTDSWLPVRHREVITRPNGKKLITVTTFKNYQEFGGIKIPLKQVIKVTKPSGEQFNEEYLLSDIKVGLEVSDMLFTKGRN